MVTNNIYRIRAESLIDLIRSQLYSTDQHSEIIDGSGVEGWETGMLFFAFWDSCDLTDNPPQPEVMDGLEIDTSFIVSKLETYAEVDYPAASVVLSALTSGEIQFRFEIYNDGDVEVYNRENWSCDQAVHYLTQMLENGGNPFDSKQEYFP